ncbi:MAG: HRDC domain-containing protein [Polyangiaceae bacterium]|nr:HRDC domain-containing protein [Polyangiaceae bacterium]
MLVDPYPRFPRDAPGRARALCYALTRVYELVDTPAGLSCAARALAGADRLYLDTEFQSAHGRCTLSLVQISRGERVFVVDALRLSDLSPLGPVMNTTSTEWVVHAGRQDAQLLTSRLGLGGRPRVFDTQVAWALLTAEAAVSLAYLSYRLLGIRPGKAFQTDDWMRRPLTDPQLEYAASDVEHLPDLLAHLDREASARHRAGLVRLATADQLWPEPELPEKLTLASFRNAWHLGLESQAALRALVDWYAAQPAESRADGPDPRTLMAMAARLPTSATELERLRGVPKRWAAQHAERVISIMNDAAHTAAPSEFIALTPSPYATFFDYRLDAWLQTMRAELCERLQAAPDLLLPRRHLSRIGQAVVGGASAAELSKVITGWRATLLEDAIERYVEQHPPPQPKP